MTDVDKALTCVREVVNKEVRRQLDGRTLDVAARERVFTALRQSIASQIAKAAGPIFDTNIQIETISEKDYSCEVRISSTNPAVNQFLKEALEGKRELDCPINTDNLRKEHKPMKFTKIDWAKHEGEPVVTFSSTTPKLMDVELPISCAKPEYLATQKGKIAALLINYKPFLEDKDNVEKTRHCLYVDQPTWAAIKKEYDAWIAQQPQGAAK